MVWVGEGGRGGRVVDLLPTPNITSGSFSYLSNFTLKLKSYRVDRWVHLDYNVSSGPFWSFDFGD